MLEPAGLNQPAGGERPIHGNPDFTAWEIYCRVGLYLWKMAGHFFREAEKPVQSAGFPERPFGLTPGR